MSEGLKYLEHTYWDDSFKTGKVCEDVLQHCNVLESSMNIVEKEVHNFIH